MSLWFVIIFPSSSNNFVIDWTLEKTLEDKLAYSDNAIIDNTILNNEIDKLEK
jgi:hypothetical protein